MSQFTLAILLQLIVEICYYLNRVQCLQLTHNCDNENRQCTDSVSVHKAGLTMYSTCMRIFPFGTQKSVHINRCPYNKQVNFKENLVIRTTKTAVSNIQVSILSGCPYNKVINCITEVMCCGE